MWQQGKKCFKKKVLTLFFQFLFFIIMLIEFLGGFVPPDELVAAIEDVSARLHLQVNLRVLFEVFCCMVKSDPCIVLQDTATTVLHTALTTMKPEYSSSASPDAHTFDQRNSSLSSSVEDEASQSEIEGSFVAEAVNEVGCFFVDDRTIMF